MTVAFLRLHGPYAQIPEGFGRLYTLTGECGLNPVGMPAAVYLTSPAIVPEAEARWELWLPVAGTPEPHEPDAASLGVKVVDPTLVVSAMHRGPYDTLPETYEQMTAFISEHGYEPDGPIMERYYSDPNQVAPDQYLTEVLIPVRSV